MAALQWLFGDSARVSACGHGHGDMKECIDGAA